MNKPKFFTKTAEFLTSYSFLKACSFIAFALILSAILASQNYLFKGLIQNGVSQKDVVAQKTITVVDTRRTDQHKKEVAQNIDPIFAPAEDDFIKDNLVSLQSSIYQIRKKDIDDNTKRQELGLLLAISKGYKENYAVNYLLKANDETMTSLFDRTNRTLENVLATGITEKDYEKINKIVYKHLVLNVPKNQIKVITSLLEQVIVPNLVVDELATEIARKNAQSAVKPYEVTFKAGDKIVFEGEPVTKLKKVEHTV